MAWTTLTPANATAGNAILATDHYNAFANINELRDTPSFLTGANTTTETGGASADFTYSAAEVTLTPGTWIVQAAASLINTSTSDTAAVGVWNQTSGAIVADSTGPSTLTTTTGNVYVESRIIQIVVSSSTIYRVRCRRNGSSTIRASSNAGGVAAYIWALRVKTA